MKKAKIPTSRDRLKAKAIEVYQSSEDATGHPQAKSGIQELLEAIRADPSLREDGQLAKRAWQDAHEALTRPLNEISGRPLQELLPGEYFRTIPYLPTGINTNGDPDPGGSVNTLKGSIPEEERWWSLQTRAHVHENAAFALKYDHHEAFRGAVQPHHQTIGDVLDDLCPVGEDPEDTEADEEDVPEDQAP
jgi:hypothetical protein